VAMAVDGQAVVGAVALPSLGLVLGTGSPRRSPAAPAPHRGEPEPSPAFVPLSPNGWAGDVPMDRPSQDRRRHPGEAEVYVHAGGQYEWIGGAGGGGLASGLHASRIDGSRSVLATDPWLPTWWSATAVDRPVMGALDAFDGPMAE